MQKWEYRYAFVKNIKSSDSTLEYPLINGSKTKLGKRENIEGFLNQLGEDGWEMCATSTSQSELGIYVDVSLFLKRSRP